MGGRGLALGPGERACVIGAGSSGIASCQVLGARSIPYDCFEKGSQVGGNWRYLNDNGMSAAYKSLFINTSRKLMRTLRRERRRGRHGSLAARLAQRSHELRLGTPGG